MPDVTINQALALLKIHHTTLKKWCKELSIEPRKHPRDGRFYTLTTEQVEAIRQARSEMPGAAKVTPTFLPTSATASAAQHASGSFDTSEPIRAAGSPRRRSETHLTRNGVSDSLPPLPDGMVSLKDLERVYGCPKSTVVRHYTPAPGGPWSSGQAGGFPITCAYDRETAERIIAKHGRVQSAARPEVPTVKRATDLAGVLANADAVDE